MTLPLIIKNLRLFAIILLIGLAIWFYKDYQFQKSENIRQTENARQLRIADSTKFVSQILNEREINEYLQYNNSDLKNKLEANNIKLNRIESIVSQTLNYRDTSNRYTDISKLLKAIEQKKTLSIPFTDSTKCLVNKGFVKYANDSLKVIFTSRTFKNKTDGVAYWERRQWKFLGIKTRFLGKKEITSTTFSECGDVKITKIEKKPKK